MESHRGQVKIDDKQTVLRRLEYEAVIGLVRALREMGIVIRATCPRCGAEGTISTLSHSGYKYLIIRHPDKSTHTIPKKFIDKVVVPRLCAVKKNLEELYMKYETAKFCTDGKPGT